LCLYFITSSAWGLAERKLLPKASGADAPGGGGASKLAFWKKGAPTNGAQASGGSKRRTKSRRR
jgi:hypothetical protein